MIFFLYAYILFSGFKYKYISKLYARCNLTISVRWYVSSHYVGNIPPCAEEQLPIPANGSVNCTQRVDHVKCTLTCNDNFKFGISEDFSLQYCRDGVWDYQRDQVEIPDCQREHTHVSLYYCRIWLYTIAYISCYIRIPILITVNSI